MPILRRVNGALERAALVAVVVMMAAMCALTFAQALGRYALDFSITWSEELSRFLMIWISMLGAAVAARRRLHVGFESLTAALPARVRTAVRAGGLLVAIATFGCMAWYGVTLSLFNMRELSAALQWPMGIPYAAVPLGALLLVVFLVEELWLLLAGTDAAPSSLEWSSR